MIYEKNHRDDIISYLYNNYSQFKVTEKAIIYRIISIASDISNQNMLVDLFNKLYITKLNTVVEPNKIKIS